MILGLGHVAQVGKDTFAEALVEHRGFKRLAFADALRQFVYETHPDVRDVVDRLGWEDGKRAYRKLVRGTLLDVGQAARRRIGPDVWIRCVARQVTPYRHFVITDVRYPNELEWLRTYKDGLAVRIDRPGHKANDAADRALLDASWDRVVVNEGSIDDLHAKALRMATTWTANA